MTLREKLLYGTFLKVKPKKEIERPIITKVVSIDSVEIKYKKEIKKSFNKSKKNKPVIVKKEVNKGYFNIIPINASVIYYTNSVTSCAIGYIYERNFYVLPKRLYNEWAVPLYGRYILENESELVKMLKIKFGEYFKEIVKEKED